VQRLPVIERSLDRDRGEIGLDLADVDPLELGPRLRRVERIVPDGLDQLVRYLVVAANRKGAQKRGHFVGGRTPHVVALRDLAVVPVWD
jgi:hypothetical protein